MIRLFACLAAIAAVGIYRSSRIEVLSAWLLLLFVACLSAKGLMVEQALDVRDLVESWERVWGVSNLLLLGALALLCARWAPWVMLLISLSVSLIGVGDLLYYRYFQDGLSLYLWDGVGQLSSITDSAWRLTEKDDLLFLWDLPLWVWCGLRWRKLEGFEVARPLAVQALVVGAACCGAYLLRLPSSKNTLLLKRFRNVAIIQRIGMINYHLYDIYQTLERKIGGLGRWEGDLDSVRARVEKSRASNDQHSAFHGMLNGRNLIIVQLESLQVFALNAEVEGEAVMPFTREFMQDCLVLELYDQSNHGRSSDGEFAMLNGLHPPPTRPLCFAFPDNQYQGLPAVLAQDGYHSVYALPYTGAFWNARHMSSRYGFQEQWFLDDFEPARKEEKLGWGMTDEALYRRVLKRLEEVKKPFLAYVVTLGGHHPYEELDQDQQELEFPENWGDKITRNYLQVCRHRDHSLRYLVSAFDSSPLAENSALLLVGDHDARVGEAGLKALGRQNTLLEDKVPMLLYAPGTELRGAPGGLAGQIDLCPVLLDLFGRPNSMTGLGQNVLTQPRSWLVSREGYALNDQGGWLRLDDFLSEKGREGLNEDQARRLAREAEAELDASQALLQLDLVKKWVLSSEG